MIIDNAIGAPVHDEYVVNGLNLIWKYIYLLILTQLNLLEIKGVAIKLQFKHQIKQET